MKLVHLMTETPFGHRSATFLCRGNNCTECNLKFKCYTELEDLQLDVKFANNEDFSSWLNRKTHSTSYRQGTCKFRDYIKCLNSGTMHN